MCGADEFIDFSAHIELVLKSGCNFRENLYYPLRGTIKMNYLKVG